MSTEFIYASVNCAAYRPMFLDEHLHYAESSLGELYGKRANLNAKDIAIHIERLLIDRRATQAGNIVNIYFSPDGSHNLEVVQSTIYTGYVHLGVKATAILEQYELPFEGHRTAISLSTANYMKHLANRREAHIAIRVNYQNNIISAGDYPVVIVENSRIILPYGAPFCFEVELLHRLCRLANVGIATEPVDTKRFLQADGVFTFGISGIQSIVSCQGKFFSHSMTNHLERFIHQLK